MNKLIKGAAAAVAAASILLNTALPVLAGTTLVISGNGSDSNSEIDLDLNQTTAVSQSNEAYIKNDVDASAETGENKANRNTGGSVSIDTGNAKTDVDVSNQVNSNVAEVNCCQGDIDVLIEGNGDNSTNLVEVEVPDEEVTGTGTFVNQTNRAKIYNEVDAEASTGDNDAKRNTGGDVSITTGNATTGVTVSNQANSNSAHVSGNDNGVMLSARILGNGSDSDNEIDLDYNRTLVVNQSNSAYVKNDVDAEAETGENDASRNTGGTVSIDTGDAKTDVEVDNMFNFNWADVDCGCLLDVLAKIAGNGDNSDNEIEAELGDNLFVNQSNTCGFKHHREYHTRPCETEVDAEASTGDNDAKRNTGDPGVDPSISTGNATTDVLIENSGNSNVFGDVAPQWDWELPWPGFSFNLNISFSLSDLLAALLG